jgi:hypothetical protein
MSLPYPSALHRNTREEASMTLRTVGRRTGATLAVTAAVVSSLALASPASADSNGMLFTGGGRGLTADVAIRRAIDDATVSAGAYQLYTCTPVGRPQVFETFNDPYFGHVFRAQADVFCTP